MLRGHENVVRIFKNPTIVDILLVGNAYLRSATETGFSLRLNIFKLFDYDA